MHDATTNIMRIFNKRPLYLETVKIFTKIIKRFSRCKLWVKGFYSNKMAKLPVASLDETIILRKIYDVRVLEITCLQAHTYTHTQFCLDLRILTHR